MKSELSSGIHSQQKLNMTISELEVLIKKAMILSKEIGAWIKVQTHVNDRKAKLQTENN